MSKDCIFCKIVQGEISCYKIWEDDYFLVFLDAYPTMKGEVLIIPKNHLGGYIFNLEEKDYSKILLVAKKISKAIDKSLNPLRTGMVLEGLEVDHIHIKLYPLNGPLDISSKLKFNELEMEQIAKEISKEI